MVETPRKTQQLRLILALCWALVPLAAAPAQAGGQVLTLNCTQAGLDSDRDGLSDDCEFSLLYRFAPLLVVSSRACNWDAASERLGGGYLVGAHPMATGVRLAYLPAYFEDCGWRGAKCLLRPRGGCDPHEGDSEAVFVDVSRAGDDDSWSVSRVFLSAHCFGRSDGRCRWFTHQELQWDGSSAIIWVAQGKNANYPSRRACDSGHWLYDSCDANDRVFRFPVRSERQNIGSVQAPFPKADTNECIAATELLAPLSSPARECLWTADRFGGWSGGQGNGATGYRRYLRDIAGFIPD